MSHKINRPLSLMIVLIAIMITLVVGSAFAQTLTDADTPPQRNTADTVSLSPDDVNSYRSFAPELAETRARIPQLNPETGIYVEEFKPNLFYITDGVYQSAFLVTTDGVIVFDAPPSYAHLIRDVIADNAPDQPIKYLVYSHAHTDHNGGAGAFADVPDLQIVAPEAIIPSLEELGNPNILVPNLTYTDDYTIELGGEIVEITTSHFHAEDVDAIIYLPEQKFLVAVDTITPGEVPFMNFGATADVGAYLTMFDTILAYDFDTMLSGHLSFLSTRDDVLASQAYTLDVQAEVLSRMPSLYDRLGEALVAIDFENENLAYRIAMESIRDDCTTAIIDNWQDRLSVVDVWAHSHCQTMVLYYIMH